MVSMASMQDYSREFHNESRYETRYETPTISDEMFLKNLLKEFGDFFHTKKEKNQFHLETLQPYSKYMQSSHIPQNARLKMHFKNTHGFEITDKKKLEKKWNTDLHSCPLSLSHSIVQKKSYSVRFEGTDRLLECVLYTICENWLTFTDVEKKKFKEKFKFKLCEKYSYIFNSNILRNYTCEETGERITKMSLYGKLCHLDIEPCVLHYMSEFLNTNIIVVYDENQFQQCSFWEKDRNTLVIWDDEKNSSGVFVYTEHPFDYTDLCDMSDRNPTRTPSFVFHKNDALKKFFTDLKKKTKKELEDLAAPILGDFNHNTQSKYKK